VASYYISDHLGSVTGAFDASKASLGTREFTPYGTAYLDTLPGTITRGFTGHDWDPVANLNYAPFRYLNPGTARWMKRDPLGMIDGPNMYGYVGGNPVMYFDPMGLDLRDVMDRWSGREKKKEEKKPTKKKDHFSGPFWSWLFGFLVSGGKQAVQSGTSATSSNIPGLEIGTSLAQGAGPLIEYTGNQMQNDQHVERMSEECATNGNKMDIPDTPGLYGKPMNDN
jgi:RHS repeat-associated protein